MITILEAATSARITKQKVRYWLQLLEIEPTRKEGKLYLPAAAVDLLTAMNKAVLSGIAPAVAAIEVKQLHALPVESPAPICAQDTESAARINELEKAVLLLAESNQSILKQNQDLIAQVKGLAAIINKQSKKIDLITHTPKITAEDSHQQTRIKKNTVNLPLFKRLWYELFNPEYLRATP